MSPRTIALTGLALVAFAANSILCRLALKAGLIDPVAFTQVRLLSGAFALAPLFVWRGAMPGISLRQWWPAAALFAYAIAFSLAYVAMGAGVGALLFLGEDLSLRLGVATAAIGGGIALTIWAGRAKAAEAAQAAGAGPSRASR